MPGSVVLLPWEAAGRLGAAVAVTTRFGGVSLPPYDSLNLGLHVGDDAASVITNRRRAAAAFGVDLADMVFARQVHGTAVVVVGTSDRGRGTTGEDDAVEGADVLVTTTPAVTLVIGVADCVPVALIDPVAGVLAAVHAGWRGTAGGAVAAALAAMEGLGAHAHRVHAYLGPAVDQQRYQVTAEVHDGLAHAVRPDPLGPGVAERDGPRHWRVDLVAANRQQLQRAGVPPGSIAMSERRTDDDALFSDRAARPCGRFALLARLLG